ncbi:MAG: efflux RND transporter periplasmic adaptor subunit [Actinobacteria bacterium]|nr:MAG: efflux RND transporter periplasmic adaptor subunit [Actinomycetota bacterium]
MSKGKIIAGVVILLGVVGVIAGVAYGAKNSAPEVEVAEVTKSDLAVTVSASGKVVPGTRADVFPPTTGMIAGVAVKDGQQVKAGQTLATMDTGPLEMSVAQAAAGVAGARSQLSAIDKQAPSQYDRNAAQAGVAAAWAVYEPAKDAYDAFKEVYDETTDTVVKQSMEPSLTALDISQKQLYAAYASAVAAESKTDLSFAAERDAAYAAIDQAEEALALANDTLGKATLKAPADGIVLFNALGAPGADGQAPKAATGAAVTPGAAPFTIVQLNALRFAAEVDEVDIDRVDLGMKGVITLDAFPGEEFASKASEIAPAAQLTATGGTVFPVYFDLTGTGREILIGMKGDVSVEVKAVTGTVSVPIEALFDDEDKQFVYVLAGDDTIKRRDVETGVLTDTRAQIVEGLQAGDKVALSGATELKDGMAVRVK